MDTGKLLSVIMPSYNMERYLAVCVDSLLDVDDAMRTRLDVIIVNDGSKDKTVEIANAYAAKHPGVVRVIDKQNGNYGSCVNRGLREAVGEFVRVLDADDCQAHDGFQLLLQTLAGVEDEVDLVVTDYQNISPDGELGKIVRFAVPEGRSFALDEASDSIDRFSLHAITYRRSVFGRFDYVQTEGISYTDTEWILEPMLFVRKARYLPVVATRYLVGRDGQTMDANTYSRNFHQVCSIMVGLAARFESLSPRAVNTSIAYVRHHIATMILYIYYANFYKIEGASGYPNDDLGKFDADLRQASRSFYDEVGDYHINSRFFPVKPVLSFRKRGTKNTATIILSRHYIAILAWVHKKRT